MMEKKIFLEDETDEKARKEEKKLKKQENKELMDRINEERLAVKDIRENLTVEE